MIDVTFIEVLPAPGLPSVAPAGWTVLGATTSGVLCCRFGSEWTVSNTRFVLVAEKRGFCD